MKYNEDDVSHVKVINDPTLNHEDFEVNGLNYLDRESYYCPNNHSGAEPRVLPYVSSYNASTSKVMITGYIVFVCPVCEEAVKMAKVEDREYPPTARSRVKPRPKAKPKFDY